MKKGEFKPKIHKAIVNVVRPILADRFPNCFVYPGQPKRPLKIGIGGDILLAMPELGVFAVSVTLTDYTHGARYCEAASVEGAIRIDLDGKEAGRVTGNEAHNMRMRLERFNRQNGNQPPHPTVHSDFAPKAEAAE